MASCSTSDEDGNISPAINDRKIVSQKLKKPDELDVYLESVGLCRKRIPRDGNSLFRCIADQLLGSQTLYPNVRTAVLTYFWDHQTDIKQPAANITYSNVSYIDYMIHKCITAIGTVYKSNITVYKEVTLEKHLYTFEQDDSRHVMLCVDSELLWDSVYTHERMSVMAFCQAEVYRILYNKVFKLQNVDYAVTKMLDKSKKFSLHSLRSSKSQSTVVRLALGDFNEYDEERNLKILVDKGIPPFPYKVAKSLDPSIYRNIDFDVWDSQTVSTIPAHKHLLKVGSKCIVHLKENIKCIGYVQNISSEKELAQVFVEQLGEIREIPMTILEVIQNPSSRSLNQHLRRAPTPVKKGNRSQVKARIGLSEAFSLDQEHDESQAEPNGGNLIDGDGIATNNSQTLGADESDVAIPNGIPARTINVDCPVMSYPMFYSEGCTLPRIQAVDENVTYRPRSSQAAQDANQLTPCSSTSFSYPAYVPCYSSAVNVLANYSYAFDGSDLPFADATTLRYFFNLGIQYFREIQMSRSNQVIPVDETPISTVFMPISTPQTPETPIEGTPVLFYSEALEYEQPVPFSPLSIQDPHCQLQIFMQELSLPGTPQSMSMMEEWRSGDVSTPSDAQCPPTFLIQAPTGVTAQPSVMQHWPSAYPFSP